MIWYCDSSALVKRYVNEQGSSWFRQQLSQHDLLVSELAVAEIASTLARRKRQGTISDFEFHSGRGQFARHLQAGQYAFLQTNRRTVNQAAILIYRYPLVAYDAIHLAAALIHWQTGGIIPNQFCFVTADDQLRAAAEASGLQTENPNDHP